MTESLNITYSIAGIVAVLFDMLSRNIIIKGNTTVFSEKPLPQHTLGVNK